MEQGKVFISSVLNLEVEDLRKERDTAREVVKSYRFLRPWAFEKTPASTDDLDESYLKEVDECDLFVLITGRESTNPVTAELLRAKKQGKPILLFAKSVENRTPHAQSLLQLAGKKYASFETLEELRQAVQDAIDLALVDGLRALPNKTSSVSILGRLQQLADKKEIVRIRSTIPSKAEQDKFHVREATLNVVVAEKLSSNHIVRIPTSRITEILAAEPNEPPVVLLDGRLQWLTLSKVWKFLEEKPPLGSHFGFSKISYPTDSHATEIENKLRTMGYDPTWKVEERIAPALAGGAEVFYDEDGRYLYWKEDNPSILIVRRGK